MLPIGTVGFSDRVPEFPADEIEYTWQGSNLQPSVP